MDPVKFVVLLYAQASLDISFFVPMARPRTGGMNAATTATAPGSLLKFLDDQSSSGVTLPENVDVGSSSSYRILIRFPGSQVRL